MSANETQTKTLQWYKVLTKGELPEGRVKTAVAGHKTLCIAHNEGPNNENATPCPHQADQMG